jgi:trk system potassium uptake protein TrkH
MTLFFSAICYYISKGADPDKFSNRDGFLAVTLSWIIFSILGSLPYLLSGTIPTFINAFFESTSGLSTTGSSILKNVEILPHSILFWRSLTHWIGGLGMIVILIIILPSIRATGYQLFALESSMK